MSQDASVSTDGPIDFDGVSLRQVRKVPRTVLDRELRRVFEAAETPSQTIAGFSSRLSNHSPPHVGRWVEPSPGTDTVDPGEK
jgi:FXSXX-COOH protein